MIRAYIRLNGKLVAQITADGSVYYYHTDHLGTPPQKKMTDQSGTVVWAADYLPFGKADVTLETVENNLRFAGQYYDTMTGLHYNWHRYYDPGTGRYVTADPIGLDGGINLYAYAGNDPVNLIDPLGLEIRSPEGMFRWLLGEIGKSLRNTGNKILPDASGFQLSGSTVNPFFSEDTKSIGAGGVWAVNWMGFYDNPSQDGWYTFSSLPCLDEAGFDMGVSLESVWGWAQEAGRENLMQKL